MASSKDILKKSQEIKKKKRIGLVAICFFVIVFVFAGSLYIANAHTFLIKDIRVSGNDVVKPADLLARVERSLAGRYYYLYSKKNIFIWPKAQVLADIKAEFPRIKELGVEISSDGNLFIDLKERQPTAIFCSETSSGEKCYFADQAGLLYAESPEFSENVFYKIYKNLGDEPIGRVAMMPTDFKNLVDTLKIIPGIFSHSSSGDLSLTKVVLNDADNYELYFSDRLHVGESCKLILKKDQKPEEIASNLSTVLNSVAFQKEYSNGAKQLDYLDLRLGKKIFYKFK